MKENLKPFIHKFETAKHCYIYDVNTNRVFEVGDALFQIINEDENEDPEKIKARYPKFSFEEIKESLKEISEARAKGFFSSHRPSKMGFNNSTSIEVLCGTATHEHLILNVTDKCNLRCRYCVYGGNYNGYRTHSEKEMTLETAKEATDKFLDRAGDKIFISFYGGEPLLNFGLIKSVIGYITKRFTRKVNWSMTTNGTLLTPEKCKYLVEKGFLLNISLDGPKRIHDRYRVYQDGTGTFDDVMKNLEYMNSNYSEYYGKNVTFSVVNAPPFYLTEVEAFFRENPILKNNYVNFNFMNYNIKDFCYAATSKDYDAYDKDWRELSRSFFCQVARENKQSNLIKGMFEKAFIRFYHRLKVERLEILMPNGCCIPGARRIFVSVDGSLHVCEKMDNSYKIGDVAHWIDPGLIRMLYDEYVELSKDCFNCWACRLCTRCFSCFVCNSQLDKDTRTSECISTRAHLNNVFIGYYTIHEQNESALDYLQDMKLE